MISICMNDRQQVITNVWAGASVSKEISMYLSYFFLLLLFFFFITQKLLLYFSSSNLFSQINHLYDV